MRVHANACSASRCFRQAAYGHGHKNSMTRRAEPCHRATSVRQATDLPGKGWLRPLPQNLWSGCPLPMWWWFRVLSQSLPVCRHSVQVAVARDKVSMLALRLLKPRRLHLSGEPSSRAYKANAYAQYNAGSHCWLAHAGRLCAGSRLATGSAGNHTDTAGRLMCWQQCVDKQCWQQAHADRQCWQVYSAVPWLVQLVLYRLI